MQLRRRKIDGPVKERTQRLTEEQTNVADLKDGLVGLLELETRILEELKAEWEKEERSRKAASTAHLPTHQPIVNLNSDPDAPRQLIENALPRKEICPCGAEYCWTLESFADVPEQRFPNGPPTTTTISLNVVKYAEYSFVRAGETAPRNCAHGGKGRCGTCVRNAKGQKGSLLPARLQSRM